MSISKCPRCSKPINQALAMCMGCGADLRSSPMMWLIGFVTLIAAGIGIAMFVAPKLF